MNSRLEKILKWQNSQSPMSTRLILADENQAEFIFRLRNDPKLNLFLSKPPENAGQQRAWLGEYKKRESDGKEFYFIIQANQQNFGTVRLYNFVDDVSFTWGSWIVNREAPLRMAHQSAQLVYDIGFNLLKFKYAQFTVTDANKSVIAFHKRMGSVPIKTIDGETSFIRYNPLLR
jgi:RimJ/RimL family protein N-acetyltransferase